MTRFVAIIFGLACVVSGHAQAQLANGGFETGTFPPWTTTGTDSVTGTFSGQAPIEGNFQAHISCPQGGTVTEGSLETFLGLNSGTLAPLRRGGPPGGGSAFRQIFTVQEGQAISFDWDYFPNGSSGQNDTAFFTLHPSASSSSSFTVLASIGGSPTGYQHYGTGPLRAGSYLLGFCAYDALGFGNNAQRPDLLIDNVQQLSCLPPPTGLISWWPAEGNAIDISGGNAGDFNIPTYASGEVGQGFSLNGINQFIEVPDSPNLSLTGPFTIDAWIKTNDIASQHAIVEKYDTPGLNDCVRSEEPT